MPTESTAVTLGIMAKFWEPGRVKTRLGAAVGMRRAAALHRLFVTHLCQQLASTADRCTVCLDPAEQIEAFRRELRSRRLDKWETIEQGGGTLGRRIQRWFQSVMTEGRSAILIGADCPTLNEEVIDLAQQLLQTHHVVLGPATDGGYVLIGIRSPWEPGAGGHERLFRDIPWSTPEVLPLTRQRIQRAGWSLAELKPMTDVDTDKDLDQLRDQLRTRPPADRQNQSGLREGIESILNDPDLHEAGR